LHRNANGILSNLTFSAAKDALACANAICSADNFPDMAAASAFLVAKAACASATSNFLADSPAFV
jgi:hypothetical protein